MNWIDREKKTIHLAQGKHIRDLLGEDLIAIKVKDLDYMAHRLEECDPNFRYVAQLVRENKKSVGTPMCLRAILGEYRMLIGAPKYEMGYFRNKDFHTKTGRALRLKHEEKYWVKAPTGRPKSISEYPKSLARGQKSSRISAAKTQIFREKQTTFGKNY